MNKKAKMQEKSMVYERAKEREKTRQLERARHVEKTISDERAINLKKTRSKKRIKLAAPKQPVSVFGRGTGFLSFFDRSLSTLKV